MTGPLDHAQPDPRNLLAHPAGERGELRVGLAGDQVDGAAQFPQTFPKRGEAAVPDRLKAERQRLRRVRRPSRHEGVAGG